jgi:hypothetical protein
MFFVMAAIASILLFHDILGTYNAIVVLVDAIAVGFILFALIEVFGKCAFLNPVFALVLGT